MPSICKDCNRPIKGSRRNHKCDMAKLSDGRIVHMDRVRDPEDEIYKKLEAGELEIAYRINPDPIKHVNEKFLIGGMSNHE